MSQGQKGEKGEKGERGERGPARRWGPLYGYIAASIIMAILVYALLFQVRGELIDSCNRVNDLRVSFNARERPIDDALHALVDTRRSGSFHTVLQFEIKEHRGEEEASAAKAALAQAHGEAARLARDIQQTHSIPLTDCEAKFPRPFPF